MIEIPTFETKEQLYSYLRENKNIFLTAKKSVTKFADSVNFGLAEIIENSEIVSKSETTLDITDLSKFTVNAVINTTNLLDSHGDVHIDGIWSKSIKEQKNLYLLEEHKMSFRNIISDKVTAKVKQVSWEDLGFDFSGNTQALIFAAEIEKNRNEYMAEQYSKGRVKNHSVGMRYVKIEMAMDSENKYDIEEKAVWDKYINIIANKEEAIAKGYFWAVTEAKIVEGSAVPLGSNFATPTISIGKIEPLKNTQQNNEPSKDTRQSKSNKKVLFNL